MYLKSLKIQGFKSFANTTNFKFSDGITMVVGPNGSGKSNVSDAIRWVLGEQSNKNLRFQKMEDVIFMGADEKNPSGYCKVSITIDNKNKIINSNLDEIEIARKCYRTGESEYLLNGKIARLRDIQMLIMDTGLSKEGYSVIGQGKIDQILSLKNTDRRSFFDEATGITKYRYQKDEALKQIYKTEENMVRLVDILNEKNLRLIPLEKQKENAILYLKLADELRDVEINLWGQDLHILSQNINQNQTRIASLQSEIDDTKLEQNRLELYIDKNNLKSKAINEEIEQILSDNNKKNNACSDLKTKVAVFENQTKNITSEIEKNKNQIEDLKKKLLEKDSEDSQIFDEIEQINHNIQNINHNIFKLEEAYAQKKNILSNLKNKYFQLEERKQQFTKAKNDLEFAKEKLNNQSNFIKNSIESFDIYPKSVKAIMQNNSLKKIATVGEVIKFEKEYYYAINSVVSGALNNIITQNTNEAIECIEYIKNHKLGTATFLPLDKVKAFKTSAEPYENMRGFVSHAVDVVLHDDKFKSIINRFFGDVIIFDCAENARAVKNNAKIVTLDGEVFYKGGAISGGRTTKDFGILAQNKKILDISEEISQKSIEILEINDKIKDTDILMMKLFGQNNKNIDQLELELSEIKQSIYEQKSNVLVLENDINHQKNAKISSQSDKDEIKENITKLYDSEKSNLSNISKIELEVLNTTEEIKKISTQIKRNSDLVLEKREQIAKNDNENKIFNAKIKDIFESRINIERKLENAKNMQDTNFEKQAEIQKKLLEKYDKTYSSVMDKLDLTIDYSDLKFKTMKVNQEIKKIGSVNLSAIEEYDQVFLEYEELNRQVEDLQKSKSDIMKIITDLTQEMSQKFLEEFDRLNQAFSEVFNDLFSGGTGYLKLSDPENILDSGIEIKACPKGKTMKSLSLLSGGERAFIAIAIFFAILKCKPTPFCVLDEIDAALDENNVHKFAKYLEKHKGDTQFIVITHRKGTMKSANTLYGITMEQKGVSKMVSLDID